MAHLSPPADTGRSAVAEALVGTSRSAEIDESEDIYAPLLGAWDVESVDHLPDGSTITAHGEWLFSRALDGRAIQDVLILPSPAGDGTRPAHPRIRYGTSVRTLHPVTRRWQVTWLNPVSGAFDVLHVRKDGDRIVQEGTRPDGQPIRWSFDGLTGDRFHWRGEAQREDGSWGVETEFFGKRRAWAGR